MWARIKHRGHESWYSTVVSVVATDRDYLSLTLSAYPHRVYFWRANGDVSVLLAETGEDVTRLLREERLAEI